MTTHAELEALQAIAGRMVSALELSGSPVGVRLLSADTERPLQAKSLKHHRYCQALMQARHGEDVILDGQGIACPAAAAAFGFRPLPKELQSGKGLVGFGIISKAEVGQQMFEHMPRFEPGWLKYLHLYPLTRATDDPDLVIVEDEVEKLMWIALAYLHATGGKRIVASTAILQAACVDSTIIPYQEQRLNLCYGCYGCRDATDIARGEAIIGFPGSMLPPVAEHLDFLAQKALPASRAKKAYAALQKQSSDAAGSYHEVAE